MVMSEEEKKQKHREYQRKWREANPDKATQNYNDWVEANREKRRASWRKSRGINTPLTSRRWSA